MYNTKLNLNNIETYITSHSTTTLIIFNLYTSPVFLSLSTIHHLLKQKVLYINLKNE